MYQKETEKSISMRLRNISGDSLRPSLPERSSLATVSASILSFIMSASALSFFSLTERARAVTDIAISAATAMKSGR